MGQTRVIKSQMWLFWAPSKYFIIIKCIFLQYIFYTVAFYNNFTIVSRLFLFENIFDSVLFRFAHPLNFHMFNFSTYWDALFLFSKPFSSFVFVPFLPFQVNSITLNGTDFNLKPKYLFHYYNMSSVMYWGVRVNHCLRLQ